MSQLAGTAVRCGEPVDFASGAGEEQSLVSVAQALHTIKETTHLFVPILFRFVYPEPVLANDRF
jgi:hypothetical protein|eukprot:COSAG06_NODE_2485_length_6786_cov_3.510244_7_plen_64_part_00